MKILVTGGAGFIGSAFVRKAIRDGHHVINVDKLTYSGNKNNLKEINNKQHRFVVANICNESIIRDLMKNAEIVVHFAAESHVTRSETNPEIFYKTNLEGTRTLLKCASKMNGLKKFIHISTDEVYGSAESIKFKEGDKLIGDSQASSAYSKSKSLADDLALSYADRLPIVVARPTNNFGPYQYPEKALPRWTIRLIQGKQIPVWGKGENVRDWLFVEDTIRAIDLLIERGKVGEVYNIAANNHPEIRNIDLAMLLVKYFKYDRSFIQLVPDPRPHHDFRYSLDTGKIGRLGFLPSKDSRPLIINTVEWYVQNSWWWTPLVSDAEGIYTDIKV